MDSGEIEDMQDEITDRLRTTNKHLNSWVASRLSIVENQLVIMQALHRILETLKKP